jgi:hypothetical protein
MELAESTMVPGLSREKVMNDEALIHGENERIVNRGVSGLSVKLCKYRRYVGFWACGEV